MGARRRATCVYRGIRHSDALRVIDTNIEYLTHASVTGGTLVREHSGRLGNSRFGFRGTEDLRGGTSAWFVLEAGFNSNDGTPATADTLFNRTAAVGLSNALGSLSAGLQYTAMYDTPEKYDPMGYAPQYTWFPTTGWMGVPSGDYSLSRRTGLYATVAYAAATRYANGTYTPVGVTDATAFASDRTGVTLGIRHRFRALCAVDWPIQIIQDA